MAILKIHKDDSEYLHKKADLVTFPLSDEVNTLISDMKETLNSKKSAVGLAAPQVGASLAIIVCKLANLEEPFVMINPTIIKSADMDHGQFEMCLSYPDEVYDVVRAKRIAVRFYDEFGYHYVLKYRTQDATIIQHEVDHLLGITIKDRGKPVNKQVVDAILGALSGDNKDLDLEEGEGDNNEED